MFLITSSVMLPTHRVISGLVYNKCPNPVFKWTSTFLLVFPPPTIALQPNIVYHYFQIKPKPASAQKSIQCMNAALIATIDNIDEICIDKIYIDKAYIVKYT